MQPTLLYRNSAPAVRDRYNAWCNPSSRGTRCRSNLLALRFSNSVPHYPSGRS